MSLLENLKRSPTLLVVLLLVVVMTSMFALTAGTYFRTREIATETASGLESSNVLRLIGRVTRQAEEAQIEAYEFLISGKVRQREEYYSVKSSLLKSEGELLAYQSDHRQFDVIYKPLREYLSSLDAMVELRERTTLVDALQLILTRRNIEALDALKAALLSLEEREVATLSDRYERSLEISDALLGMAAAALGLILFAGLMVLLLLRREFFRQARKRKELQEAADLRARFLAQMSHDIRTPLNAVIGLVELSLLEGTRPEVVQENLRTAEEASHHLLEVVNMVLDLSKIEAGAFELHRESLKTRTFFESMLKPLKVLSRSQGGTLTATVDESLPEWMRVDRRVLGQCIYNIVGNAVKFSSGGQVQVSVLKEGDALVVSVKDDGPGIPADQIEDLFQPYRQLGDGRSRSKGTGLGLSITKNLIEEMDGKIEVESEQGQGTRVTLRLPLEVGSAVELAEEVSDVSGTSALVVEDDALNRVVLAQMFKKLGVVGCFVDGLKEAQAALLTMSFDIIFMDFELEHTTGPEVTLELRKDGVELPIVGLTANAMDSTRQECLAAGMNDFETKPVSLLSISRKIAKWVKKEEVLRASGD